MNIRRLIVLAVTLLALSRTGFAEPPKADAPPAKPDSPQSLITTDRLMQHIRDLPTSRAAWGDENSKQGLRDTEAQVMKKLNDIGYVPTLDPVDFLGSRAGNKDGDPAAPAPAASPDEKPAADQQPWNNIIVEIPGKSRRNEVLILSAHLDAVAGAPGADDDGTGIATVLEAARILKDYPTQRTVRLIFFNLEEVGLVGSRAYVQRIKPELEDKKYTIVGMASIDMIGFYSDKPDSQKSPLPPMGAFKPPTVADFIGMAGILSHRHFSQAFEKAMHAAEPAVKTINVDFLPIAPPDLLRSDHAPFLGAGVPAIILSDTANFRNANYHKPTDTIETIDQERFTTGARAVIGALYALAGPVGTELIDLSPPKPAPQPEQPAPPKPADAPSSTPPPTKP